MKMARSPVSARTWIWLVGLLVAGSTSRTWTQGSAAPLTLVREGEVEVASIRGTSGLTFSPVAGALLLLRPGKSGFDAAVLDAWAKSPRAVRHVPSGTANLANVAFDAHGGRLLAIDESRDRLIAIPADASGLPDGDQRREYDARRLGLTTPTSLAVDSGGRVFILDAEGPRIVRVDPPSDGSLDSAEATVIDLDDLAGKALRGLAIDPDGGHLHLLDPEHDELFELTQDGELVASRDLSTLGVHDARGVTFAPSADETDEPSRSSLYFIGSRTAGGGSSTQNLQIYEASFTATAVPAASFVSSLVATRRTSSFSPPSPDPDGIVYVPTSDTLCISDSEVEEMSIYQSVNVWNITKTGVVLDTAKTTSFSGEPAGLGMNPATGHFFFSDDDKFKIHEVHSPPDGECHTNDFPVTSFSTSAFGSRDDEDVVVDTRDGSLYVIDGVNAEIYHVKPGSNGIFDGVPSAGDDQVSRCDVAQHGITDPEGIAFNSDSATLYVVGKPATRVAQVTTTCGLVQILDVSAANAVKPAGLTYGRASDGSGKRRLYIVDRVIDNGESSKENDGKMYEMTLPTAASPTPTPTVAGPIVRDVRIATGPNDGEERVDGAVGLNSVDLELVLNTEGGVTGNQTVGLRFTSVAIPRGAQIASAYVQFKAAETGSTATTLTIRGQPADNAAAFATTTGNISSRPRTTSFTNWSPPAWNVVNEVGSAQRTSDVAAVVQEIVSRPGWASGNSLVLVITGTGKRVAKSFDGDAAGAPLLHVVYTAN